jgi:hypothetical protein
MTQCSCKQGYASPIDNKCRNCRSRKEQQRFEDRRRAYNLGYEKALRFPNIQPIACPYPVTKIHMQEAWLQGVSAANQAVGRFQASKG